MYGGIESSCSEWNEDKKWPKSLREARESGGDGEPRFPPWAPSRYTNLTYVRFFSMSTLGNRIELFRTEWGREVTKITLRSERAGARFETSLSEYSRVILPRTRLAKQDDIRVGYARQRARIPPLWTLFDSKNTLLWEYFNEVFSLP